MANVSEYLKKILSARYGKDVRQSIHDSIDAINTQVAESETSALASATNAANSASTASTKASSASTSATEAASSAVMAQSYAKGGTGSREGEDADNAKYYAEQAKAVANIDIATTEKAGIVKPDGTSVTVDSDGTIHAQTGTNIEKLSDIGDVNIQNPQDKQALVYNSETQTWENGQGSVSPIDNLTSNSTTEPLSANQGRVLNNQKLQKEVISDEWNASITYAVGQYCIHNNILWKCLVANTNTEPTEGTHWTKVSVANEITSLNSSLTQNIIYQDYNNGDVSINANARDYYAFNIEKPGYVILGATPIGSYENVIDYIITLSHSSYTATLVRKNNYGAVVTCRQAIRVIYKKL